MQQTLVEILDEICTKHFVLSFSIKIFGRLIAVRINFGLKQSYAQTFVEMIVFPYPYDLIDTVTHQ